MEKTRKTKSTLGKKLALAGGIYALSIVCPPAAVAATAIKIVTGLSSIEGPIDLILNGSDLIS